ncbi:MAG: hypothetical protein KAX44_06525 [Candidatus Brocadiae bacterium]|nr:hypothetical protein [Candidatus Brocadiia bacterium]
MDPIRLRPHHLLDIVTRYKPDDDPDYVREPGGNNVRTFTRMFSKDLDIPAEFIVGWDFICEPCSHLQPDGSCDQVLTRHDPPLRMDDYNDPLDTRLLKYLDMEPGTVMTVRQFLELVNEHVPGIEEAYAQPTEAKEARRAGLINGLVQLGIRSAE